jgi:recombination DNA repair RAD52 pathway protein
MSDNIKKKIESIEFNKMILDVLYQIKVKYEILDITISELRKDFNRLYGKVETFEAVRTEVEQVKIKVDGGFETTRKELSKKVDGVAKSNKEINEQMSKLLELMNKKEPQEKPLEPTTTKVEDSKE